MMHVVHCVTNFIMYYPSKYVIKQALGSAVKHVVNCMTNYLCLYAYNYVNRYVKKRLHDSNLDHYEKIICMHVFNIATKHVLYYCIGIMRKQTNKCVTNFIRYPYIRK